MVILPIRRADVEAVSLSIRSIQELEEMPSGQRFKLIGSCYLQSFADWRTWAGLLTAVAFSILGQMAIRYTFPQLTSRQAPLFGFSGAVVFWLVGSHVSSKIRGRVVRKLIRKRFPHLCSDCGYDLRMTSNRCPECGAEF